MGRPPWNYLVTFKSLRITEVVSFGAKIRSTTRSNRDADVRLAQTNIKLKEKPLGKRLSDRDH
jgi:hypothetical protein